ncbi:sensor histidine kinase [Streptomyces aureocirculatus]|uniref:sensor histidine kinase n=1 Tax=Streptomyces aureocirculatus TaxID=67275 RepID=UPI00056837BC|nr:sensor histidine kinase [Streptomyces aureocirculatus]
MSATPTPPLLKRLPPGAWTALAWWVGSAFTVLTRFRLPGEAEPAQQGVLFFRWDGLTMLATATALALAGSHLLDRRPLAGLGLLLGASAGMSTTLSVAEIPLLQFVAVDVAVYAITATRPRRTGAVALALALGTLTAYLATRLACGWVVGTSAELTVALTAVVAWLLGDAARRSRDHAEELRTRAAAQAVTAERLRIARELHDMVAHSIGIIALQSGAARRVIDSRPGRAREALGEVETASRETLSGLRRMLGALRTAEPGAPREQAPLDPGLGLADVDRLAAVTTAAGVRVDVRWLGERGPLPPEIDVSAYRIIQEALTNVVRHAGARSCRVTVERRGDDVAIEVLDGGSDSPAAGSVSGSGAGAGAASLSGSGAGAGAASGSGSGGGCGAGAAPGSGSGCGPPVGGGYGLLGMRERVGLLHGEFSARPCPGGGFRVAARLPVPEGVR